MSGKKLIKAPSKLKSGFTLIEMMIVISLMVMLLLTSTSLFFTSLIGSSKTNASAQVKQEGDFALGQMEFLLRNAIQVQGNCTLGMTEITFKSLDSGVTTLLAETDPSDGRDKIASQAATNQYLTSGGLELINGPVFNCVNNGDGSPPYVEMTFSLRKGTPGVDQARDIVEETFSTGTSVRGSY